MEFKLMSLLVIISTFCLILLTSISSALPTKEAILISEPQPGQEFVQLSVASPSEQKDKKPILLKLSTAGTRKAFAKEKSSFETAHKIPVTLKEHDHETLEPLKLAEAKKSSSHKIVDTKNVKRHAEPNAEPVEPPHPGAIKIDPLKLIEKYRSELETSKDTVQTTPNSMLTTGSPSTQRTFDIKSNNKKTASNKKSNIQTRSVDGKVTAGGSENGQRSRIEVKKGPNGQDYEYEYVYYYYDDDEANSATGKDSKEKEKVTNSHDGPQRNAISSNGKLNAKNKYTTIERSTTEQPEPASNEIVPSIRSSTRQRGRQLQTEPAVDTERLPANTRFPPRSRTLSTTPTTTTEEPTTKASSRSRSRGRPQNTDNVADESNTSSSSNNQNTVSRSRGRSNVRRPSLELVDSASFKTHASDVSVSQYKDLPNQNDDSVATKPNFPAHLPEGPMRFLGATNERMDLAEESTETKDESTSENKNKEEGSLFEDNESSDADTKETHDTTTENGITTTLSDEMNAAMDKVALDLYAILQGTQNMMEDTDQVSTTDSESILTTEDSTGSTFEYSTTEEIIQTTTTTTTTTTPAPTTTTTTEPSTTAATGRNRFRARGTVGSNRFKSASTTTTTEASASESTSSKPKGRFGSSGRTSGFGGRTRLNSRTTTTESSIAESAVNKEEAKPVSHSRPSVGSRSRFGTASRGRFTTTTSTTPASEGGESSAPAASVTRSSITRPRPNFNLKRRGGVPTTQSTSETPSVEHSENEQEEKQEKQETTTTRTIRGRPGGNSLVKPLRPGARINISPRGRLGATTTTTTVAPEKSGNDEESNEEPIEVDEDSEKKSETTPAPANESPLSRLRNRARLSIAPKAKTPASTPVPITRRANPLLNRRKPIGSPSAPSSTEATPESHDNVTEVTNEENDATALPEKEVSKEAGVSSTTEAEHPKGLSGLLAGRKRLVNRKPGTIL